MGEARKRKRRWVVLAIVGVLIVTLGFVGGWLRDLYGPARLTEVVHTGGDLVLFEVSSANVGRGVGDGTHRLVALDPETGTVLGRASMDPGSLVGVGAGNAYYWDEEAGLVVLDLPGLEVSSDTIDAVQALVGSEHQSMSGSGPEFVSADGTIRCLDLERGTLVPSTDRKCPSSPAFADGWTVPRSADDLLRMVPAADSEATVFEVDGRRLEGRHLEPQIMVRLDDSWIVSERPSFSSDARRVDRLSSSDGRSTWARPLETRSPRAQRMGTELLLLWDYDEALHGVDLATGHVRWTR